MSRDEIEKPVLNHGPQDDELTGGELPFDRSVSKGYLKLEGGGGMGRAARGV